MSRDFGADDVVVVDHSGSFIKLVINDIAQLKVGSSEVHISGNLVLSGNLNGLSAVSGSIYALTSSVGALNASGDITAAGGMRQTHQFYIAHLLQGQSAPMTASQMTSAIGSQMNCVGIPLFAPNGGSILGYSIQPLDGATIVEGAITASVTLNGVATYGTNWAAGSGGTVGGYANKDSFTFTHGGLLGVAISASADYTNSVATTSASYVINVCVEI